MITKQFLQPLINGLNLTPGTPTYDVDFRLGSYYYRISSEFQIAYSLYGDLCAFRYSQYHLPYYFALIHSFKEVKHPIALLNDKAAYKAFCDVCEAILNKSYMNSDAAKYSYLINKLWPNNEELKSHIKMYKLGKIKYGEVDTCY